MVGAGKGSLKMGERIVAVMFSGCRSMLDEMRQRQPEKGLLMMRTATAAMRFAGRGGG